MRPVDIEFLIHCHAYHEPHPRQHALAIKESIEFWTQADCIKCNETEPTPTPVYSCTPRGRAMVKALCQTPMPRIAWLDAQGKELS